MPAKTRQARTVEQLLQGIEKEERARGLLDLRASKPLTGLLGATPAALIGDAPEAPATGGLPEQPSPAGQKAETLGLIAAAVGSKPNIDGSAGAFARPGILSAGVAPRQPQKGLLTAAPLPAPDSERSRWAQTGNFLDDLLFGGAAGERREVRRQRDEGRALADAHRDAFSRASTAQGFDPNLYAARMAELGQAPGIDGLVNLEGINDGRDVRDFRHRAERRNVVGGALAGVTRLPDDQRPQALAGVADYLAGEGYGIDPNMSSSRLNAAVGAAMGADGYLDNDRGERVLGETQRSNLAAEAYRGQDLQFRQGESEWERQYRESRANADDQYRTQELGLREKALTAPNSTGDVLAPILSKVASMGPASLTEGERLIWERYQQSGQMAGGWGAMPGVPMLPGVSPAASPAPAAAQDPLAGIEEGEIIYQDGVGYQRRGNQMVPVPAGAAD